MTGARRHTIAGGTLDPDTTAPEDASR